MFYPYSQGKPLCVVGTSLFGTWLFPAIYRQCLGTVSEYGGHVGDWEHVSLEFRVSAVSARAQTRRFLYLHLRYIISSFLSVPSFLIHAVTAIFFVYCYLHCFCLTLPILSNFLSFVIQSRSILSQHGRMCTKILFVETCFCLQIKRGQRVDKI
jgi:hypothetical protein